MFKNFFDLKVDISFLFLFVITLASIFDVSGLLVLGIAAAILHEIGHLVSAYIFQLPDKHLSFKPFGIKFQCDISSLSYNNEIIFYFSGPLINFLLFIVFYTLNGHIFGIYNLVIMAFNSLPIIPMDGGRILSCILKKEFSIEKVERITVIIGIIFAVIIICISISLFAYTGNFSMIIVASYLLIYYILKIKIEKTDIF